MPKREGYDRCLPCFKAGETSDRGANNRRGGDGPLSVTQDGLEYPLFDAFLEAGGQSGQGRSDDLNRMAQTDHPFYQVSLEGRRCSAMSWHRELL